MTKTICVQNRDIVITDPCYLDHTSAVNHNERLAEPFRSKSGLYIHEDTIYGDWGCHVFTNLKLKREIEHHLEECWDLIERRISDPEEVRELFVEMTNKIVSMFSLGHFCADSGQVCVALLDEVLAYNPNWLVWQESHSWCAAIIRDFSGTVSYHTHTPSYASEPRAYIEGVGSINFRSVQTSL